MTPTITHWTSRIALTVAFATAFASCNKEEVVGERLPNGKHPVNLVAAMQGIEKNTTRATSDNTWNGSEMIAVQIGGVVKRYTITNAANGTLSAHSDNEPFYWQSTTEQKILAAWTPFSATQPTSFTVEADQSAEGYQQSDLIYVAPTSLSYGSSQAIPFKHLPAKVVVNVRAGKGVTQSEVQSATVTLLNQNLTSGTVATDWSVAQQTSGSSTITPKLLGTPAVGYHKSVEAIVVPQTIATGTRLLQITIGAGHFYYTPTDEQSMGAGEQCTYQITVNATGLSVSTQISDWTNTEVTGDAEMEELPIGSKSAEQAAVGDFYFSDGSLEDKDATLTAEQKVACIGIVFWKDPVNHAKGKVVSVAEAIDIKWSTEQVQTNVANMTDGRANMTSIAQYIADNGKSWDVYPAFKWVAQLNGRADGGWDAATDKWYLPAKEELMALSNVKSTVTNSQKKIGTTDLSSGFYWSSSENVDYPDTGVLIINLERGKVEGGFKDGSRWVRSVLAF